MPALGEMVHRYFLKKTDGEHSMDLGQHGTFRKKIS